MSRDNVQGGLSNDAANLADLREFTESVEHVCGCFLTLGLLDDNIDRVCVVVQPCSVTCEVAMDAVKQAMDRPLPFVVVLPRERTA